MDEERTRAIVDVTSKAPAPNSVLTPKFINCGSNCGSKADSVQNFNANTAQGQNCTGKENQLSADYRNVKDIRLSAGDTTVTNESERNGTKKSPASHGAPNETESNQRTYKATQGKDKDDTTRESNANDSEKTNSSNRDSEIMSVYDNDSVAEKSEVTKLSDSLFIYPNQNVSNHNNVYEGKIKSDVHDDRFCVIKFARKSEQNVREAKILTKLSHTHVISMIDSGIYRDMLEERVYIALEKCHEQNLHQHLMEHKTSGREFNFTEALEYCKQIVAGVTYIHEKLIIHKDLKPSNILLTHDKSTIKIADFGLSEEIKSSTSKVYSKHQFGTNGFRPPESFGNGWASLKSDTFSLGVVFYFILSNGESPFGDDCTLRVHNTLKGKVNLSHLSFPPTKIFRHLIELMLNHERCHRPSIWNVADHPCWSGKQGNGNFDYYEEEIDDSDVKLQTPPQLESDDSDTEVEQTQLLLAVRKMGYNIPKDPDREEFPDGFSQQSQTSTAISQDIQPDRRLAELAVAFSQGSSATSSPGQDTALALIPTISRQKRTLVLADNKGALSSKKKRRSPSNPEDFQDCANSLDPELPETSAQPRHQSYSSLGSDQERALVPTPAASRLRSSIAPAAGVQTEPSTIEEFELYASKESITCTYPNCLKPHLLMESVEYLAYKGDYDNTENAVRRFLEQLEFQSNPRSSEFIRLAEICEGNKNLLRAALFRLAGAFTKVKEEISPTEKAFRSSDEVFNIWLYVEKLTNPNKKGVIRQELMTDGVNELTVAKFLVSLMDEIYQNCCIGNPYMVETGKNRAYALSWIGLAYLAINNIEAAVERSEDGIHQIKQLYRNGNPPFQTYARLLGTLGKCHRRKGEFKESKKVLKKARDIAYDAIDFDPEKREIFLEYIEKELAKARKSIENNE